MRKLKSHADSKRPGLHCDSPPPARRPWRELLLTAHLWLAHTPPRVINSTAGRPASMSASNLTGRTTCDAAAWAGRAHYGPGGVGGLRSVRGFGLAGLLIDGRAERGVRVVGGSAEHQQPAAVGPPRPVQGAQCLGHGRVLLVRGGGGRRPGGIESRRVGCPRVGLAAGPEGARSGGVTQLHAGRGTGRRLSVSLARLLQVRSVAQLNALRGRIRRSHQLWAERVQVAAPLGFGSGGQRGQIPADGRPSRRHVADTVDVAPPVQ
eukprot:scaffold24143_cov146-Isochrysis_galbana.AAC.2